MSVEAVATSENSAPAHEVEQTHMLARLVGVGALTLAACGVIGGVAGAAEAAFTPTTVELGPHTATVQATLHDRFEFDLGPIGSADRTSSFPVGGFKVTVKGIPVPANQTALASASTVTAQYEQLFSDPKHIEGSAISTVIKRVEHNATEGAALFGAAGLGSLLLTEPGRRRRREQQAAALATIDNLDADEDEKQTIRSALTERRQTPRKMRVVAAVTGAVLAVSCSSDVLQAAPGPGPNADPALAGTPFAGYSIHGELFQLAIDEGAVRVNQFVTETEQFYDAVEANFKTAWQQKFADTAPSRDDVNLVLSISDNHCNIGMDRVHAAVARAFGIDIVVDSGDMTMGGTAAEEECVASEADALKAKGRDLLLANGNHDSPTIARLAAKHGFHVLHLDDPYTSHGLKFLGESDVNESTFGVPMRLRGSETVEDETKAITAATAKTHPDVLVVHEPEMAEPAVINGDVPLAIDGHLHVWHAPKALNKATNSYQFIEGTSGGAKPNALTIGTLQQAAVDTVLAFDKQTNRAVGYYVVTASPDKSVSISDYIPLGQPLAEPHQLAPAP